METIKVECNICGATGLYQGFVEAKDEAVVCVTCNGTGCREIKYKLFERRKGRRGIRRVRGGSGSILDRPREENWISYKEFERWMEEE